MRELRENEDGTVSLMSNGVEVLRGKLPQGKATGLEALRKLYEVRPKDALRRLRGEMGFIKRATHLETITVELEEDEASITLAATWRDGGEFVKTYGIRDLPRSCRLRKNIIRDILTARGV